LLRHGGADEQAAKQSCGHDVFELNSGRHGTLLSPNMLPPLPVINSGRPAFPALSRPGTIDALFSLWAARLFAVSEITKMRCRLSEGFSRFGPIKSGNAYGLLVHAMLAVDADSHACLGLVGGAVWNRPGVVTTHQRQSSRSAWVIAGLGGWNCYYKPPEPITFRRGMEQFYAIHRGRLLEMRLQREVRIP
jgi:hypothetical protein